MLYRFKMAAKWPIFISRHFNFGQDLKTTFPKEFLNEIWLKVREERNIEEKEKENGDQLREGKITKKKKKKRKERSRNKKGLDHDLKRRRKWIYWRKEDETRMEENRKQGRWK